MISVRALQSPRQAKAMGVNHISFSTKILVEKGVGVYFFLGGGVGKCV